MKEKNQNWNVNHLNKPDTDFSTFKNVCGSNGSHHEH